MLQNENIEKAWHNQKCIGCITGEIIDRDKAMVMEINKHFLWIIFYSFNNIYVDIFLHVSTHESIPYTEMQWSTCIFGFKPLKDGASTK